MRIFFNLGNMPLLASRADPLRFEHTMLMSSSPSGEVVYILNPRILLRVSLFDGCCEICQVVNLVTACIAVRELRCSAPDPSIHVAMYLDPSGRNPVGFPNYSVILGITSTMSICRKQVDLTRDKVLKPDPHPTPAPLGGWRSMPGCTTTTTSPLILDLGIRYPAPRPAP